ncbi:hypothetical protein SFIMM107S_07179 [Streptomyces griseus]
MASTARRVWLFVGVALATLLVIGVVGMALWAQL